MTKKVTFDPRIFNSKFLLGHPRVQSPNPWDLTWILTWIFIIVRPFNVEWFEFHQIFSKCFHRFRKASKPLQCTPSGWPSKKELVCLSRPREWKCVTHCQPWFYVRKKNIEKTSGVIKDVLDTLGLNTDMLFLAPRSCLSTTALELPCFTFQGCGLVADGHLFDEDFL